MAFVFRSGALAQAVGFKEDGELDHERLMEVWNSGALPKVIGLDPKWAKQVVRDAADGDDADVTDVKVLGRSLLDLEDL